MKEENSPEKEKLKEMEARNLSDIEFRKYIVIRKYQFFEVSPLLLSTVATPVFYIPTNSVQGFSFLHILSNTCCLLFYSMMAILTGMKWYLTMV